MSLLIDQKDLVKAANLHNFRLDPLAGVLMSLLSLDKINKLYQDNEHLDGVDFVDGVLEDLNLKLDLRQGDLDKIPAEGPFIVVANHPMGGLEGLLLIQQIARKRPDVKILVNYLLKKVEPIAEYFLAVDPFEGEKQKQNSVSGLKEALRHIRNDHPVCFFPAGEVSSYRKEVRAVADRKWQNGVIKFIRKTDVPVVPIYFDGSTGALFQVMGLIHPQLRTANLANQLFKRSGEKVSMRIGKAISPEFLNSFESTEETARYLRAKTYALGTPLKVKPFFKLNLEGVRPKRQLASETPLELIKTELAGLEHRKIFSQNEFDVYITSAREIPRILPEIGRLRELTFRVVGEGTNRSRDTDEFDLYYHHLFLWDTEKEKLVGAYRLGKGKDILFRYGRKGFYTSSLFSYEKEFLPVLSSSIELGRSFIVPEYQKKILPLFILWKGILSFLLRNKEYRFLLGPVSISNYYSGLSKSLMVEFIKKYYFDADLARHVQPRKRFKFKSKKVDARDLVKCGKEDLRYMDQLINDIEPSGMSMPVLLKKYIKQNARIIGFNVDPKFEKALDGLMVLDLNDVPVKTLADLQRDFKL